MPNDVLPVSDNVFVMRADSTTKVQSGARGRDSIRISSQKTYTDAVIVLDVAHMPEGCGTWPAFWTVTAGKWPYGGEIDILEVGSSIFFSPIVSSNGIYLGLGGEYGHSELGLLTYIRGMYDVAIKETDRVSSIFHCMHLTYN